MANSGVPSLLAVDVKSNSLDHDNLDGHDDQDYSNDYFVRIRGLPFSATIEDILEFFTGVEVVGQDTGITFTYTRDGKPSGEAYVCVASPEDQAAALAKNKKHIGSRYIEAVILSILVFEANRDEMEYVVKKSGPTVDTSSGDGMLRMRGLPFGCSKEEIVQFFMGYEIVPNGITMTTDAHGRTAGDAYVQFSTQSVAERAINDKNMKRIGHRYIELFRSTLLEARGAGMGGMGGGRRPMRPAPYDRSDRFNGPRGGAGGGGGAGYDDFPAPRDRFASSGSGGGRYGRDFKDSSRGGYGNGGGYSSGGYSSGGGSGGGSGDRFRNGMSRGRGGPIGVGGRGGFSARSTNTSMHKSSTGHSVHMRGLPFAAGEEDIAMFFAPLQPIEISLGMNAAGRKSGEADVDFETHDEACEAMKKDKSNMDHRYIELFLNSSSSGGGGGSGYGGGGMRMSARSRHQDFGGPPSMSESRFNSLGNGGGYDNGNDLFSNRSAPGNYGFNSSQIPPNESNTYY